jgi:hypothetical protein
MIGRRVVVAPNDEIAEIFPRNEPLWPEMSVCKHQSLAIRNEEPPIDFLATGSL